MRKMASGKVIIGGGSGRIGQILSSQLQSDGYEVTVLTRNPEQSRARLHSNVKVAKWDPYKKGKWKKELESSKAVINLSGANIAVKGSAEYKKEVVDSRVKTTRIMVEAMKDLENKPEVFISGSAIGIYGNDSISSEEHTESSKPGDDFFGKLGVDWENAALGASDLGVRTAMIRTSIVLSMKGGALLELYKMFKRHLGGYIKPGNQWLPWIHVLDEISVFKFIMENSAIEGPVNACTEQNVTMRELADAIGKIMKRRVVMGVPVSIIKLRMGENYKLVTTGKKVMPEVLKKHNFQYQFPDLDKALIDLIGKNEY